MISYNIEDLIIEVFYQEDNEFIIIDIFHHNKNKKHVEKIFSVCMNMVIFDSFYDHLIAAIRHDYYINEWNFFGIHIKLENENNLYKLYKLFKQYKNIFIINKHNKPGSILSIMLKDNKIELVDFASEVNDILGNIDQKLYSFNNSSTINNEENIEKSPEGCNDIV